MSEYQRFVSYLYEYHKDIKGENRGFVKVDSRERRCRITLRVNAFSLPEHTPVKIYGFLRQKNAITGILLGELPAANGCVYGVLNAVPENLAGSGYALSRLGGMIFFAGNGKVYATQWDDIPILPSAFTAQTPAAEPDTPPEELHIASSEAQPVPAADPRSGQWEAICRDYESIEPFSDDEIAPCVKITPQDFPALQRMGFFISSSQFLLYGYYNYRHLLLGRAQRRETPEYLLGIPGLYDAKEQFMAELFGYSHFKPSRADFGENASFGYWYRTIA